MGYPYTFAPFNNQYILLALGKKTGLMGILYNPLLCLAQQQVTLDVIPGATNVSYDLNTVPGILNYLYGCRSRLGLDLSDPEHTTKIGVSAVKNNFLIILSLMANVLEINPALILRSVTSQEELFVAIPTGCEFEMKRLNSSENFAHIIWASKCDVADIPLGSDSFVFEDGKIKFHTVALYQRKN